MLQAGHIRSRPLRKMLQAEPSAPSPDAFASVHAVASRFSQHVATLSIAHGLAECAHATLLSLRKNARDAPAGAPEWRRSAERCGWLGIEARRSLLDLAGCPGRKFVISEFKPYAQCAGIGDDVLKSARTEDRPLDETLKVLRPDEVEPPYALSPYLPFIVLYRRPPGTNPPVIETSLYANAVRVGSTFVLPHMKLVPSLAPPCNLSVPIFSKPILSS
jgi:hypothetical protein